MQPSYLLLLVTIFFIYCSQPSASRRGWREDSVSNFSLHAQPEVRSADHLQETGKKLEMVRNELLALLHEDSYSPRIDVYFLKDRETLTGFTGFPANGYTDTDKNKIYFVDKDPFHLAFRHELMHDLSWNLWGKPSGYWLSEGIAVFASGTCGSYDLYTLAHDISKRNQLVEFDTLIDDFDFKALEPSLQSASMVKYIYENYGISVLKAIWQNGWDVIPTVTTTTKQKLISQWKSFIEDKKFEAPIDYSIIRRQGCE